MVSSSFTNMPIRQVLSFLLILAVSLVLARSDSGAIAQVVDPAGNFSGQLLVASPGMGDPRFRRSVVYMVEHNAEGALGVIINKTYGKGLLANLMKGFGMESGGTNERITLHFGGPVAADGAFILHTGEYKSPRSKPVDKAISFTTDTRILKDVAIGKGPRRLLFVLGYAGWSAGQLEDEIARGDWSLSEASEELVFGDSKDDVWERIVGGSEVPL